MRADVSVNDGRATVVRSIDSVFAEMPGSFRISRGDVPATQRAEYLCRKCGAPVDGDALITGNEDMLENCPKGGSHEPEPVPCAWANSAAIRVDPEEDSVTVSISVDDPRGAFTMTVRQIDGQLYLYVPHAHMGGPHMTMTEINAGAFRLGH
jgi:hypothetical protein